ncbi:MAG: hypothetical protein H0W30_01945 [Gemmatimonadaceae bacterium]|nr:hypothetical protein [Gemmatimonadaceae bacterium]
MPTRAITVDGRRWDVSHSGRITQYDRDEFSLLFISDVEGTKEVRVTRYSPLGARWREQSLAEMTDQDLLRLFGYSQPSFTSPETGYRP